jgi:selenocysteine-specific elongation factor
MAVTRNDLVIGVAGHIDHGKTALVRALTGIDTDRLPEEKARGITIELGFAHLKLPNERRAAVIDMPGHERFVRTMISGAGGVDVMLLVVAANEGVMPQTREHLAIAGLIGVRHGVCALTKCDLASPDIVELATEEIREVMRGSALEGAEVVPVSAHAGMGMDALREALGAVKVTARDFSGPVLFPIDRVFVRKGFGVVVTGTLLSGALRIDDGLLLGPTGADHRTLTVRVRGLQVHGEAATEVRAGTRVAVNLSGVDLADVPRGAWLMHPTEVCLSQTFDAEVSLLPQTRRAIPRRTRLEVAAGATHAIAGLSLLEGESLEPGHTAIVRMRSDRPLALRPGERLVLRGPPSLAGVGSTVGGAIVIRPAAERVRKRALAFERAQRSRDATPTVRCGVELVAAGQHGLTRAEIMARSGYRVGGNAKTDGVIALTADRYVSRLLVDAMQKDILQKLSDFHGKNPAEKGIERRVFAALGDDVFVDHCLGELVAASKITRTGDILARMGWKPRGEDDVPFMAQVRASLVRQGLAPPRIDEMATACGATTKEIEQALKRLVDVGYVVKVSQEIFADAAAMKDLENRLVAHLEAKNTVDAQGFKELTGQSRKYTIPYAEYFDAKKVTLRIGDVRKLRGR